MYPLHHHLSHTDQSVVRYNHLPSS
jgi:hypothetical protein